MKNNNMTLTQKMMHILTSLIKIKPVFADEQNAGGTEPVTNPTQPPVANPTNPTGTSTTGDTLTGANPTQPVGGVQSTISFEQLISQARQEEKNKLYPQITGLKTEVANLTQRNNSLLLSLGEKENTIQDLTNQLNLAKTNQGDPQVIVDLKAKIAELEKTNGELNASIEGAKLDKFKETEIAKLNGQVISEMITGTTEEEILASIKKSNEVFLSILSKSGGVANPTQPPVANPSSNTVFGNTQVSTEQIAGMSMSDYANYRKSLGLK